MQGRPRMRNVSAEDDSDAVSWDELGDAINFCRRRSLESVGTSHTNASSASANSNMNHHHRDSSLPTVYPGNEESFSSVRDDKYMQHLNGRMASQDFAAGQISNGRPKRTVQHSSREEKMEGLRGSSTSWDDLGDEIAMALRQSMVIDKQSLKGNGFESSVAPSPPKNPTINECSEPYSNGDDNTEGAWNCPACTFLNENPLHLVCAICGTAKAEKASPPPPPIIPHVESPSAAKYPSHRPISPQQHVGLRSNRSSTESFDSFHDDYMEQNNYHHPRRRETGASFDRDVMSTSASVQSRMRKGSYRHRGGKVSRDEMSRSSRRSFRGSQRQHDYRGGGFIDYDDVSYGSDERIGGKIGLDGFDDDDDDCSDLSDEETAREFMPDDTTIKTMKTIKKLSVPAGDVTIIYTDVQGSTSLWEADPANMKKATDIHDSIIRKCYSDHGGYEISTEGDSFNLAFQHPADAIGFALKAQWQLFRARWPDGILNHPDGCHNEKKAFRGFRVRMGMHHGPTTSTVHETTGRTIYQGEAVDIAKAIEKMSHGGQILTTVETWRAVSGMAEQFLGKPQVMDCGEHLLWDPKKTPRKSKEKLSKRILQLVPNQLAYDFFAARGGQKVEEGVQPSRVCGRVFPPLLSNGQLSTSFLNAPYVGNRVAMVFVYTDKMDSIEEKDRKKNHTILAKYIRSHLMRLSPPGYECQEDKGSWMLAFDRIENGIKFGLNLNESVLKSNDLRGNVDKKRLFRIGIHWGPFLSMGPHTITGHADYFGPLVNRAARVAAQCEPGQVCVGVPMGDDEEPPDPGPSVEVDVLGVKQLKGISIEMAIFACRKREKVKKDEIISC